MQHENFEKYLDAKFEPKLISPNDGYHYFFGYDGGKSSNVLPFYLYTN